MPPASRISTASAGTSKPVWSMIDLFAGCGGLTRGFVSTGRFAPVAAVEQDLAAAATYAANFGEDHVHWGAIEDWVTKELPSAHLIVGGPPCQGFSNLGKRDADDRRNELWRHYVEALRLVRPRAFLLENVDRFASSRQYEELVGETRRGGLLEDYELRASLVRATDFGSPQLRRRFIVIGTHRDLPVITVPTGSVPWEHRGTVGRAFEGRGGSKGTKSLIAAHIDPDDQHLPVTVDERFGRPVPGWFLTPQLHVTRFYTRKSIERFVHIPRNGNRLDLPDRLKAPCWLGHDKGSLDVMGRLRWMEPSVTIRTEFFKPEKGRYLHPEQHRAISHYEAARLQGFPDDHRWCGSKLQIARQIGNAVPVDLAQGLGQHIADRLS